MNKLARCALVTSLVLDIALAHWMVWLSTEGQKTEGLWFKFGGVWCIIMIFVTCASAAWEIESGSK